jgi:hypothetical protein
MPKGIKFTSLESMKEEIEKLEETQQKIIFKILKDDNIIVMENADGVFFDIVSLPKTTLQSIITYLELCKKNKEDMEEREKQEESFRRELTNNLSTNE